MFFSMKDQIDEYRIWLNIAKRIRLNWLHVINRYDFITFNFIFIAALLLFVMNFSILQNTLLAILIIHLTVGFLILKPRTLIIYVIMALREDMELGSDLTLFLLHKYSLFLVSQGKKPLSEYELESLQNHTATFSNNRITRGGRKEAIKRFQLAFLKKEKIKLELLFVTLILFEFVILY